MEITLIVSEYFGGSVKAARQM